MRRRLTGVVVLCGVLCGGLDSLAAQERPFIRGDVNQDSVTDISDAVAALFHLFAPNREASCEKAADANDDGSVDVSDPIYTLEYLFQGGPRAPPPVDVCGVDATPDDLTCNATWCEEQPVRVAVRSVCTPGVGDELGWEISNLQAWSITVDWEVEGTDQSGTFDLSALQTVSVTTVRVPGSNHLTVYHGGEVVARRAQASAILSEIVASNADSLRDEDGDSSDWIEIHLPGSACVPSIDLTGWYLTDNPDRLDKWQFPSVSLEAGGFLVVFASGKDRAVEGEELHTGFNLDSDGEYVALVAADGMSIVDEFSPSYPEQLTDVSYGPSQWQVELVGLRDQARYHVPTADDAPVGDGWAEPEYEASDWEIGRTGLGFTDIPSEGFEVTYVKATGFFVRVRNVNEARAILADPGRQGQVTTATAQIIDYFNTDERGNFTNDNPFPGIGFDNVDNFIVTVTGTILIPEPGPWSFGVNSDDGFELTLSGGGEVFTMAFPTERGSADTIEVFNVTQPGEYDVDLLYFERRGGAQLEFFAAQGNHPTFSFDQFRLVGDTQNGGLPLVGFGSDIATDVSREMQGDNASLWARIPFTVDDADALGSLLLRMKYEDGFVAYLNGHEVASQNAPDALTWDAAASADRSLDEIPLVEEIDLTNDLGFLEDGPNLLAIHGLNDTPADGNFLLAPELIAFGRESLVTYMPTPTPGTHNVAGSVDFVRPVALSLERGFYDSAQELTLSTPTSDVEIRYTLNGSTPTATSVSVYAGPIRLDATTVIRAAAFRPNFLPSDVRTSSYFFVSDVIRQSPTGQRPGSGWPAGSVNGQAIHYGMDPDIVNSATWGSQVEPALLAIPTLSLVTDLDNLFGSSTGIYVNARNDGRAWERRTSVELIHPDGTEGFAVDAGLRIRGAFSRSGSNPKHSFRLIFRGEYGAGKLEYPLFGGEGVDSFDRVDLRTSQNCSWAFEGSAKNTLLRDVFSRDVQRDMGQPYTRSRYYHLYLNGQYWGIYQTQERADADFAESYLRGNEDDYDVIKNDSSGSRALHATDGTMDAYERLYDAAVAGFSSDAAYTAIQGLLPDGSPNPGGERLLDPENLMDYMICTYYTGDPDAPVSCWAHFSNNVFAIYSRVRQEGFQWFRHDAEHSLGAHSGGGLNESRLLTDSTDRSIGQQWRHFNPAWLHLRLTTNDEYLMEFADRVNKYFSDTGLLSSAPNIERWSERVSQIELAIVAESARWGDSQTNPPRTKNDWLGQVNYMVDTYFPQRTQLVINQMRSVGMFPTEARVSFNQHGGEVESGFEVTMSQSGGTSGTIYFAADGADPRLWGGGINPDASIYEPGDTVVTVNGTTTIKARVYRSGAWGALTEARFTVGLDGLVINEFMASNDSTLEDPAEPDEYPDWIEIHNGTENTIDLGGMYLSDDLQNLTKWQVDPSVNILPGEYLIFFADDDGTQGVLHTNYKLSASGEAIVLVDQDGETILDSIVFDAQFEDVSYGRFPDGGDAWGFHTSPTPGWANEPHAEP